MFEESPWCIQVPGTFFSDEHDDDDEKFKMFDAHMANWHNACGMRNVVIMGALLTTSTVNSLMFARDLFGEFRACL